MQKNKMITVVVIMLGLILLWYARSNAGMFERSLQEVSFGRCTDGDTAHFLIAGEDVTVRLLAIDTPETKHPTKGEEPYGKEASDYTCKMITDAQDIRLEYDPNAKEDKYGRILAWVFVDGELLQEKLVELGYAKVAYLYDDYKYTELLLQAQEEAKNSKIGIWQ